MLPKTVKTLLAVFNLITPAINNSHNRFLKYQPSTQCTRRHNITTRSTKHYDKRVPLDQKIINGVFMYPSRKNIMNSKKNLVEKGVYSFRRMRVLFKSIRLIRIALKLMVNAWRMKKLSLYIFEHSNVT